MAKQTTPAAVATVAAAPAATVAPSQGVGRWARELARAAQGADIANNRAGNRFYGIAIALIGAAPAKGQTARLSFADINAATGKKRGEGSANPRAAWVRALSAVGDLHGTAPEGGVLTLELPSGKLSIRVADDNRAFELRTA
jgi:hypothetical protein